MRNIIVLYMDVHNREMQGKYYPDVNNNDTTTECE